MRINNKYFFNHNFMNECIKELYDNVTSMGLYIPKLTVDDGNCLFDCFLHFNFGDSIENIKKNIVNLLLYSKDIEFLIQDTSPENIFANYNDINYVFENNSETLYKYTFEIMAIDILSYDGWTRINTELMLSIIAILLNLRFVIIHNTGYTHTIEFEKNENTKTYFLGLLCEHHYVPLVMIEDEKIPECIFY